jgi:murein DD-endopeptidase MepM/ murein hydrolase activator NlpD
MKMKKPYKYFFIGLFILALISILINYAPKRKADSLLAHQDSLLLASKIKMEYGLPIDSFEIIKGTIKKNTILGDIMSEFSIPAKVIGEIEEAAKGVFDFKRIKAGNIFAFLKPKTGSDAKYFIYEHSPTEYYIVDLTDSVTVEKREKATVTYHKTVSGVINSSLWNAMEDQKINPLVAVQLSEIFAWSIDFFGLQQGDAFKIMYDEQFVDSLSVGIGQIHGAWFLHAGKEFTAIPFEQDGKIEFFDADGKSLRKAFLKAPLKFSRISSGFSGCRYHPLLHRNTTHFGVDYAAASGTPVHAIGDGMVISAGRSGGAGNMIKIKHNSVYMTGYMHLRAFGPGIRSGKYVKQGDIIGYVGSTGLSTGPHLDFRVWRNNSPVNPLTIESPSVAPVKQDKMESFLLAKNAVVSQLEKVNLPEKSQPGEIKMYAITKYCVDSEAF